MSLVKPFRAVRPGQGYVEEIAALPYDVYNETEARAYVADKPNSFLKIDRAETFFEPGVDIHSTKVYEKARDVLYQMLSEGKFVQEEDEAFYLYELSMDGRSQTGLVACTSVDAYLEDGIKQHEKTRAEKELDRMHHVDYTDANTGPIFLTYKAQARISEMTGHWTRDHKPVYDMVAEDGVGHRVWVVNDSVIVEGLQKAFTAVKALYIADGHHRAASAVKVALKRREANPAYSGQEAFNFFLSVIFPDEELKILPYNRVVTDLNGQSEEAFLSKVKECMTLHLSDVPVMPEIKGTFGMYLNGQWYSLEAQQGTYDSNDPVASLDVSILQDQLLTPILGIGDPRVDDRIDFVGGIRGLKELERRVSEDMAVAFSMYPTSIEELINIADASKLMPPKSTWFEPKLRSGIFVHLLK